MFVRPDEGRLLRWTFGVATPRGHHDVGKSREGDGDEELEIFGMRPSKRSRRTGWTPGEEPWLWDVGRVPNLFGKHQTLAGETLQGAHQLGGGKPHREEVARSLAGQNWPRASATVAVPRRSIFVLAVTVADVAPPAGSRREAHL